MCELIKSDDEEVIDKISAWAADAVNAIQMAGITTGRPGSLYSPRAIATRAETATVLARYLDAIKE